MDGTLKRIYVGASLLLSLVIAGCGDRGATPRSNSNGASDAKTSVDDALVDSAVQTDEQPARQDDQRVDANLISQFRQGLRSPMPSPPWGNDDPFEIHGLHHIFWATTKLTNGKVENYSDYNGDLPQDIVGNSVRRVAISIRWDISNGIPL